MRSDLEQRIDAERREAASLYSELNAERSPFLKNQLRRAMNMLDDSDIALHLSTRAGAKNEGLWVALAETNLEAASQIRRQVQETVYNFGGPDEVTEI
jgi:hypothetical protein